MQAKEKKKSGSGDTFRMVEDIIGCKWSLTVIDLIRSGVNRPGAMRRSVLGLSTKVLNERLQKLLRYGIARKTIFPESPPRVEYDLTELGEEFVLVLDAIEKLEERIAGNTD